MFKAREIEQSKEILQEIRTLSQQVQHLLKMMEKQQEQKNHQEEKQRELSEQWERFWAYSGETGQGEIQ